MIEHLYRILIELTNGRWTSVLLKRFSESRLSRFIVPSFAKFYQLNQAEMEKKLDEFPTLHDLFIRRLKPGVRPIHADPKAIVSPVDGIIEDIGVIRATSEMEVKGKKYSASEMLGDRAILEKYLNGMYVILYLSPSNYHRIHSPATGTVTKQWTLGSKSYPVNKWGMKYGVRPLAKNYRVITELKTDYGYLAVVKVGAMFVNSIEITHKGCDINKGEEIAYFSFGSTVVLLFEKDIFHPAASIQLPAPIKVGEQIGSF